MFNKNCDDNLNMVGFNMGSNPFIEGNRRGNECDKGNAVQYTTLADPISTGVFVKKHQKIIVLPTKRGNDPHTLANFTVEAWAFFDIESPSDEQNVLEFNTGTRIIFGRRKSDNGLNAMYIYSSATNDLYTNDAAHNIIYNRWVHLAWVKEGQNFRMYIDGKNVKGNNNNSATNMAATPSASLITIGMNSDGNERMDGYLSNVRVSSTARYSADFTRPTAAFTNDSDTILLTCQNSTGSITDASSNNYTIVEHSGVAANTKVLTAFTVPTTNLTAVTNTKLLTLTETEPNIITNGSYYFTSTSNTHLKSGTSSDFTLGTSSDYTVEFWYKFPSSISSSGYLFDMGANTFVVQMFSSNTKIGTWGTGGTIIQGGSNVGVSTGDWHHIVAQRSGNVHTLYINGQLQGTKTDSGNVHNFTGTSITLNNYGGGGNYGQQVYLSDFRFVKGTAVYSGNFTPPSGPLTKTGGTYPSNTNVNTSIPSGHTKLLTAQNSSGGYIDNSDSNHTLTASGTVTPSAGIEGAPVDLSSSSHTLSLVGDTTHSYASPFAQGSGGSVYFPSSGDYLYVSTSTDLIIGTNDFTIESWAYFTNFSGYPVLFDRRQSSSNNQTIEVQTNGKLRWYSGGSYRIESDSGLNTNTWYHIAIVRSSGTTKMYINGTVQSTTYSDSTNYSGSSVFIGKHYSNSSGYLYGYISNYREVIGTAVYTSNFTVPTSKLTAVTNTKLLTCNDSNTTDDESTLSNTITVNGGAIATRFSPF